MGGRLNCHLYQRVTVKTMVGLVAFSEDVGKNNEPNVVIFRGNHDPRMFFLGPNFGPLRYLTMGRPYRFRVAAETVVGTGPYTSVFQQARQWGYRHEPFDGDVCMGI